MKNILLLMCMVVLGSISASAKVVKICTDQNLWYPYTYSDEAHKISLGLHVDITKKALQNKGYEVVFTPQPWKRCLAQAKRGTFDGVVSASYKDKRAKFLHYPKDAKSAKKSKWRVTQAEYVAVTYSRDNYVFNGDVTTLPTPVRVVKGYSIIDSLKEKGIKVDSAMGDKQNLLKLIRDKKGSVVMLPLAAKILNSEGVYKGKLKIQKVPVKSKSYYMVFSKKAKLTASQRQAIWDEIASLRADKRFMAKIGKKYIK